MQKFLNVVCVTLEYLEMHLITSESFSCDSCEIEFKHLDGLKKHKEEHHETNEIWITHAKLNRKDRDLIILHIKVKHYFQEKTNNLRTS